MEGLKVLVSGKGESGKSSVITLCVRMLLNLEYKVVSIDRDASNPNGLCRLSYGRTERSKIEPAGLMGVKLNSDK